jgi:CBS domain-containing protein
MRTVAELLKAKPARVVSVTPEMSVLDAIKVLAAEDVGAAIVMTGTRLAGILSERECMALMVEKQIRHLPVVDEGRVVGMVSIRDIVSDIIADQDFTIEQLEHYISGQ